jgi:hypothetical protein
MDDQPMRVIEPTLDHVVFAVPDLAVAVPDFEQRTGLRPAEGGRHIGRGTRNYLVGFGPTSYLEIIGPDPEHPVAQGVAMPFGLEHLTEPRLLTWAVRPPDLQRAVRDARAAGADLGAPAAMGRRTPDGSLLEWELASVVPLPFDGVTPFLIDWGRSNHPASDPELPRATLLSLSATHPDPAAVGKVLAALNVSLPLDPGPPGLMAVLETPKGAVDLR